jgi:hypothetical protein
VSNAFAVVMDNPSVLCKVAIVTTAGAVDDTLARAAVGQNAQIEQALAGVTTSGNSRLGLAKATNTTNTFPLRIIDLVEETKTVNGYVEAIVKFNTHQYNDTTGV